MSENEKGGERGVQYPGDSLREAVALLEKMKAELGFAPSSRETIAEALGYKGITGTSARKLGVLTHFELIEKVSNGVYRISELGRRILLPTSDADRATALGEAVSKPALYALLLSKLAGGALPNMLSNILVREYNVNSAGGEQAAKAFRDSLDFAGMLRNGVVSLTPEPAAPPPGVSEQPLQVGGVPAPKVDERRQADAPPPANTELYTIALDGDGKTASIRVPLPLTALGLKRIRSWIDYMSTIVDEENA